MYLVARTKINLGSKEAANANSSTVFFACRVLSNQEEYEQENQLCSSSAFIEELSRNTRAESVALSHISKNELQIFAKYHLLLYRSPMSTRLRALSLDQVSVTPREAALLGRGLAYNTVVQKLYLSTLLTGDKESDASCATILAKMPLLKVFCWHSTSWIGAFGMAKMIKEKSIPTSEFYFGDNSSVFCSFQRASEKAMNPFLFRAAYKAVVDAALKSRELKAFCFQRIVHDVRGFTAPEFHYITRLDKRVGAVNTAFQVTVKASRCSV